MDVRLPDGTIIRGVPDDMSRADLTAKLARNGYDVSKLQPAKVDPQLAGVPGMDQSAQAGNRNVGVSEPARSLGEKIEGGIETGLTLATGATSGVIGMLGGTAKGLVDSVRSGTFGTQQGVQGVEQSAAQGMEAGTYVPRFDAGQEYVGKVGEVLAETVPAMGLTSEMNAVGRVAGNVAQAAKNTAPVAAVPAALTRIRAAAPAIADRVERTLRRNPEPQRQQTGGSAGAAGRDVADLRRDAAENLPVPIDLTEGQATRDHMQTQFERETAKLEGGSKLRERYAEQNEKILQNFDALIDQQGAEAPSLRAVGQAVDEALVKKAARDKAEIRTAYKAAENAGELEAPVTLDGLVAHLNESAPDAVTAPILTAARGRALQLGLAVEDANGQLVAVPTPLKNAERYRQAVNRATDYEATNIRQSAIIKGEIDAATEGIGGELYKAARAKRAAYANEYENRASINSLLTNKRGMNDRKVALEDVFSHSILKGSLDDVKHLNRVLSAAGGEGIQAWKELRGATVNWIKERATQNVATDTRGNAIVSPAQINKAIRELDADGKLDFVFGKKGAEQMRDLNELAKLVYTAPPGTVNTSNTAATILAAIGEAGAAGAMTGIPVPVLTLLRGLARRQKDIKLQKKIDAALVRRPRPTVQPER